MEHGERYGRAREFYDVVTGLWDSWADDAFIRDVEHGIYFDPDKMHVLDHKGKYLSVRGPLNIARPIQGWPVIVQAGASDAGRQLAAETAEAVFTAQSNLAAGREFYADVKGRMEKARPRARPSQDHAGLLRRGRRHAWRRRAPSARGSTASSITPTPSPRSRSRSGTTPRSSIRTDRCPTSPRATPARAAAQRAIDLAQRENLTVRQLAQRLGGYSGLAMVGTPTTHRRRDGGMARHRRPATASPSCSRICPAGSTISSTRVVPELQRRGLFRRDYEGKTLRENLGLPRPKNRFF